MTKPTIILTTIMVMLSLSILHDVSAQQHGRGTVVLNEVIVDSVGPNPEMEFVELYTQPPNMPLSGLSVVFIQGREDLGSAEPPGHVFKRFDIPAGATSNAQGFFLISNGRTSREYGVMPHMMWPDEEPITNDTMTVALMRTNEAPNLNEVLPEGWVPPSGVLDAIALVLPTGGKTWFNAHRIGPDATFLPAGAARVRDGVHTGLIDDWEMADIKGPTETFNTPGATNAMEHFLAQRRDRNPQAVATAAAVAAASASSGTAASGDNAPWRMFEPQAAMAALQQSGNVLIYVRSEAVKRCHTFEWDFLLTPVVNRMLMNRQLFFLDVSREEMRQYHESLGVYRVPTLVLVRSNGRNEMLVVSSYTTNNELHAFLNRQ